MMDYNFCRNVKIIKIGFVTLLSVFTSQTIQAEGLLGSLEGDVNASQGGLTYTLPINAPQGINKQVPKLSLSYQQGQGNGVLGLGFSISGLSAISRCGAVENVDGYQGAVLNNSSDQFCLEGERLVPTQGALGENGTLYSASNNSFSKIVSRGSAGSGPAYWEVHSSDGFIYHYENADSVSDSGDLDSWKVTKRLDRFNNEINYNYQKLGGYSVISKINYGPHQIEFIYENRPDSFLSYQAGKEINLNKRLSGIQVSSSQQDIHNYQFSYQEVDGLSRLNAITFCEASGSNCAPATQFNWENSVNEAVEIVDFDVPSNFMTYQSADMNRDGFKDMCYLGDKGLYCALGGKDQLPENFQLWTSHLNQARWLTPNNYPSLTLIDLNNDLYPDYCIADNGGLYCGINNQNKGFSGGKYWSNINNKNRYFQDINNDRLVDICIADKTVDCYINNQSAFVEKHTISSVNWIDLGKNANSKRSSVRFVDINGDRLDDLCGIDSAGFSCQLNQGENSQGLYSYGAKQSWSNQLTQALLNTSRLLNHARYSDTTINSTLRFADLNADNLLDFCYRDKTQVNCALNTGIAFTHTQLWTTLDADYGIYDLSTSYTGLNNPLDDNIVYRSAFDSAFNLIDWNQDGRADLCSAIGNGRFACGTNKDGQFETLDEVAPLYEFIGKITIAGEEQRPLYSPLSVVDINDDTVSDLCYRSDQGVSCAIGQAKNYSKLKSIVTGYNNQTSIEYGLLTDPNVYVQGGNIGNNLLSFTPKREVVTSIETSDGIGGFNQLDFTYEGLRYDTKLGLTGFEKVSRFNSKSEVLNVTTYEQSGDFKGQVLSVESSLKGNIQEKIRYQYEIIEQQQTPKISRIRSKEKNSLSYDINGQLLSTLNTQYLSYDDYDNPTKIVDHKTGNNEYYTQTTATAYSNNQDTWLLGNPVDITVTHQNATGTIKRQTQMRYNQQGALIEVVVEPNSPSALKSEYSYDTKGNRITSAISSADGAVRSTRTEFDNNGLYAVSNTNPLGHQEHFVYSPRCGLPTKQTGPNGLSTHWEYDGICNKVKETRPDGTETTWLYQFSQGGSAGPFSDDHSVYSITEQTSGAPASTVYFDGLNREVRTKTTGFGSKTIYQDKVYNYRGLIERATLPYYEREFPGDNSYWVESTYDALGRQLSVSKPGEQGAVVTKYGYDGFRAWEENAKGIRKTTKNNLQGKTAEIIENNGQSTIRFQYDAIGNLLRSNANGYVINNEYDSNGNKIKMTDPSMGTWQYDYNGFGELLSQTDAKGQTSALTFDALGRMMTRTDIDGITTWQYDTAENGIGKLSALTTKGVTGNTFEQYYYDQYGRPVVQKKVVSNKEFITETNYDQYSRVKTVFMPDDISYDHEYQDGLLKRITMPRKQLWDYDFIALEKAMESYSEQITELQKLIISHRNKQVEYLNKADEFRIASLEWSSKADNLEPETQKLLAAAASLKNQAESHQRQADYYRSKASYYAKKFGDVYIMYHGMSGGRYQFRHYQNLGCVRRNSKGRCKQYAYKHTDIYVHPSLTGKGVAGLNYRNLKGNSTSTVTGIYPTRFYTGHADKQKNIANHYTHQANSTTAQVASVQAQIDSLQANAAAQKQLAEQNYALARQALDETQAFSNKLGDLLEAQNEVNLSLQAHLNSEEQVLIWAATSRDATGRLAGEIAGNGLLTRRVYDRFNGRLNSIKTGVDMNSPIRHLTYQYDDMDNVSQKTDVVNNLVDNYQYDSFDRLTSTRVTSPDYNDATSYSYDARGNMLYKSDAGNMEYDEANRLLTLSRNSGDSAHYQYDDNGNQIKGNGRDVAWNSFNKAAKISGANGAASFFTYGADRMRVTQLVNNSDGSVTNTIYIGKGYEHITTSDLHGNNKVQTKHYIHAEGKAIAVHTRTINNGEKEPDQFRYLHHDALESVDTITDSSGIVIQKLSFGAFGKRREINGEGVINPADKEILTNRGYTSHEHLAHLGLIHMNARLYDPETARFLSADIYIQAPESSQSHNRYIYVMNNPLKYSDPSGHFAFSFIIGAVISIISSQIDNPYIRAIGMIAGAALMGGQITGFEGGLFGSEAIFSNAFAAGFVSGGISSGSAKGAFIGGFSALATAGIGHGGKNKGTYFQKGFRTALAHGVAQGATAELRGGSFRSGFIGGFASGYAPNLGIDQKSTSAGLVMARTSVAGVFGGLVAEATGGSFRGGAFHAVWVHIFNYELVRDPESVSMEGISRASTKLSLTFEGKLPGGSLMSSVTGLPIPPAANVSLSGTMSENGEFGNLEPNAAVLYGAEVSTGSFQFTIDTTLAGQKIDYSFGMFLIVGAELHFNSNDKLVGSGFGVGWSPAIPFKWINPKAPIGTIGVTKEIDITDL